MPLPPGTRIEAGASQLGTMPVTAIFGPGGTRGEDPNGYPPLNHRSEDLVGEDRSRYADIRTMINQVGQCQLLGEIGNFWESVS